MQKEISDRRQELLAKEEALKSLEARLATSQTSNISATSDGTPAPQVREHVKRSDGIDNFFNILLSHFFVSFVVIGGG